MPTFPTLWAVGSYSLWYSENYGSTWTEIDKTTIGSGSYIGGVCGPGTIWKVYTAVESTGIWYYDGSWTLEDSVSINSRNDRTRAPSLWCSQDDSIVICSGAGDDNEFIRTRDGSPGTSWTNEFTANLAQSELLSCVHGTPDGSAIYATTALWNNGGDITARLLKRETNGTWTEVASISPSGYTIFTELRVVSATEVWIVGADGSAPTNYGKIWKWNGSTLSQEYQFNLNSYDRVGIWVSGDGAEGWVVSYNPGDVGNDYHHYNGSSWSLDQQVSNVALTVTITQLDGIPASAISGGGSSHIIPYDGTDWDDTYFPSIEIFYVSGLLLTYIEEYTAPVEPPYESPFRNQSPVSGYSRVPIYQNLIQFDVISTTCQLASNTIDAYVNDVLALSNETFYSPFDGPDAYLGAIVSDDGYDGYRIILDYTDTPWGKSQLVNIDIYVEDMCDGYIDDSWSFTTTEYIGGHFLIGQNNPNDEPGNSGPGLHFEEGVGWGAFPVAMDPTGGGSSFSSYHMDFRNNMNNIWAGMYHGWTSGPIYLVMQWDGSSWIKHIIDLSSGTTYGGGVAVSRAPRTNQVFASANMYNGRHNMWIKYDGSAWSVIRGRTGRWHYVPLSIDENTCVWAGYDHDDVNPNYYITTNTTTHTRYSGSDLPSNIGFVGISRLANGDIFLFSENGYVYRSSSIYGPFVIDNQTDGPFSGGYNSDSIFSMNSSADGQFLVIQSRSSGSYWVRDGIDNWASYNAGGSYFYLGQPAAINRQMLLRGNSSSIARVSYDGGQNWQNVEQSQSRSSCAFIDDISSNKRMLTLTNGANFEHLWWRGDAKHSPWAYWSDVRANLHSLSNIGSKISIQGFDTGHVVIGLNRGYNYYPNAIHYNPATDLWQKISISSIYGSSRNLYVFGTEYKPGKLHGVINTGSSLQYCRWNGAGYDDSNISGSSAETGRINIQADSYGTDIWITAGENQLWHSDDGGSNWNNQYNNSSNIHNKSARAYFAGTKSGNASVVWMDPDTYVVTELPSPGAGRLDAIEVIAEDDIWVGWYRGTSSHPRFGHWDGNSWTIHEHGYTDANASIGDIYAISSNEIYATCYARRVLKWDGNSWSTHIYDGSYFISEYTSIMRGSTGDDMWLSDVTSGSNQIAHWNGSAYDEAADVDTGPYNNVSGMALYKGEVYVAARDAKAYVRAGVGVWNVKFNVQNGWGPTYGYNTWWHDTENDILWSLSYDVVGTNVYGASKWDGTTETWYENTASSSTNTYGGMRGIITGQGQDAQLFYVSTGHNVQIRDSDGTWHSETIDAVGQYYKTATLQGEFTNEAKDVVVENSNEVYVALSGIPSPKTFFSKWDGYSWSVAAPSIDKDSGSRSIFVDKENDLWFFESNSSGGPTETYLLVDGYWILQDTFSWGGGSRDVTGVESIENDYMMAISLDTTNASPYTYGDGSILTNSSVDNLGWSTLRGFGQYIDPFVDMSKCSFPLIISITNGNEKNTIYNGGFQVPFNNSYVERNFNDGYDGYDFTIINDGNFSAGETTISVVIDGYENAIYDIYPQEGAIDVNSSSEIRFRIRKNGA